jgi:hypothetical protein
MTREAVLWNLLGAAVGFALLVITQIFLSVWP